MSKKNVVYYGGKVGYRKDWLVDDNAKKVMLLKTIKHVFDTIVYQGPRCNDTTPRNRHLYIILAEGETLGFATTGEKVWCSIMMHAYKKGDLEEAVFESYKTSSGQPIHIDLNMAEQTGSESQHIMEGWIVEVEDAAKITRMKDLMKSASTEACDVDLTFLKTIGYEEQ